MSAATDPGGAISEAETLALLEDLVRIPSPSGSEGAAAEFLEGYLRAANFTDVRRDAGNNILVTLAGARPGPSRAFFTHTDSAGAGTMQDPYEPKILDGKPFGKLGPVLRGLGASAPKSAIAAMVSAARAVMRAGLPGEGSVYIAIVTKDMHANHAGPREIVRSFPFDVAWMVASEPASNRLVLGARGINHYRIELTGKPTHNGRPADGVNPLYGAADILAAIERLELPTDPVLGAATASAFELVSEAAAPMTPHRAHLTVDRRTLPSETTPAVEASFRALVDDVIRRRSGLSAQVTLVRAMHSFNTPPDDPLVVRLRAAVGAALGKELETTYISFSSNAGFGISERGWSAVGYGPGSIADLGANEHVAIADVHEAARAYAAMMVC
jgi:succinyl-diaminopimelate desuccinylase